MLTLSITQALEADFSNQPASADQPGPDLTEAEAVTLAAGALRELVETKYPYTERYFKMFGRERVPSVMRADMKRRG